MAELLNLANQDNEPEDEGDRDEWLQGDLDKQQEKKDKAAERSDKQYKFFTGQDDAENTSKATVVDSAHPRSSGSSGEGQG